MTDIEQEARAEAADPGGRLVRSRGYREFASGDFAGHMDAGRRTAYYEGWKARGEYEASRSASPATREAVRRVVAAQIVNAMNYPIKVGTQVLGRDMTQTIDAVTNSLLAALDIRERSE